MNLNILKPGLLEYNEAFALQQKIKKLRYENKIDDTMILLEHNPVITLGKRAKTANIIAPENILKKNKIKIHNTTRGGDVTYHGPGQLVGYLFFDLKKHPGGIKKFVWNIQEVFIRLLADYSINGTRDDETNIGVWVGNDKITAIGIHVSHWITMHGFAFNVNTDLSHYSYINPCGIKDKGVTSLEKLLSKKVKFNEVTEKCAFNFCEVFDMEMKSVDIKGVSPA